jgi:hypothetical protein
MKRSSRTPSCAIKRCGLPRLTSQDSDVHRRSRLTGFPARDREYSRLVSLSVTAHRFRDVQARLLAARSAWSRSFGSEILASLTANRSLRATWNAISLSCGRVVQFVIVGLLHRKRSGEADNDEL